MENVKIASMADIEAFETIPLEKRMQFFNMFDMLKHGTAINPEATAISFILSGDQYQNPIHVTYHELLAKVTQTANFLYDLGVGPRDVVSYLLPSLPQTHYVLWGSEAAGIVNPVNPLLEADTITQICKAAGTRVLVALGEFPGSEIWEKACQVRKDLPGLKAVVRVMGPGDEKEGIYGFDESISRYRHDRLDSGQSIDPHDICSMYHTGGTTGTPKLAPHTHLNEAAMTHMMMLIADLFPGETIMCGLPLFHVNGTMVTGALPFSIGARVLQLSPLGYRDPTVIQNFYKIVEAYRAVTFSAVPTLLSVLLDIPKGGADISSLRHLLCGAAPLSVELFNRFEAHTGMHIIEGYGLTEGTTASCGNPLYGRRKVGSIGLRGIYQDVRIFILDSNGAFVREAETDEIGAICIKGPNVFSGYLEEVHNRGIWAKPGWLNTGDLGRRDEDGYFWLTGRQKELIIRGGHNIDPAAIEDPVYRLPAVQFAAAVGRPDPHAGEVPVAYVQLQPGAELTEAEILDFLREQISERAALPKAVFIIREMPLTPIGKIFKPALRHDAIKRVYQDELESLGDSVQALEVTVNADRLHGSVANLKIKPAPNITDIRIKEKVDEILARYTVKYRLEFE